MIREMMMGFRINCTREEGFDKKLAMLKWTIKTVPNMATKPLSRYP